MDKAEIVQKAVEKHSRTVLKIAFTYTKNVPDAEDIAQDVFLALFREKKDFQSEEHLKAWLIRVAVNKSKNHVKSNWFTKRKEMPEDLSYLPKEHNDILQTVLSLDEKYRLPIHLFYYEGYSIGEIAQILKMPSATVGTRLKRGREQLKKMFEREGYHENESI